MRTIGIRSVDEFRGMDHRAVLAWEAYMREVELAEASTIRRRCRLSGRPGYRRTFRGSSMQSMPSRSRAQSSLTSPHRLVVAAAIPERAPAPRFAPAL